VQCADPGAEERAAKLTPKLTIIMILFILPALFTVLIGPTVVNITQSLMPAMDTQGQ
jgi:pilus assembly protein TadC